MKKILAAKRNVFVIFLILISCSPKPGPVIPTVSSPSMSAFEFNERCPHVCWLGINPGTTTADNANAILQASNQIDQRWYPSDATGIVTSWHPKTLNTICKVDVVFENDLVKSISITNVEYTINDFVRILGQPDLIRIKVDKAIVNHIIYDIYFSSRRVMIKVYPAKWTGPDSNDTNLTVFLNVEPDLPDSLVDWGNNQPWLGYGHIKDYLPGVEIPTEGATLNPSQDEIPIP